MIRSRRFALSLVCVVLLTLAVVPASGEEMVLKDVPGYLWYHGCSPTAGMMIMGYWDAYGYSALIPGSNSWSWNQTAIEDAIASPGNGSRNLLNPGTPGTGHIGDYAYYGWKIDSKDNIYPDMSEINPGGAHANNCLADFMGTSRSVDNLWHGATSADNIGSGMGDYASWRGYSFTIGGDWSSMPTWADFTHEIRMGRPVMLDVDSSKGAHSVAAIGFRDTNGYREYACRDTWSTGTRWERFQPSTDSHDWGIIGMDATLRPAGTWDTDWTGSTGDWDDSASWKGGVPNGSAFAYIPSAANVTVSHPAAVKMLNNYGTIQVSDSLSTDALRNMSGATLVLNNESSVNVSADCWVDGTITQKGGTLQVENLVLYGSGESSNKATYVQEGGNLIIGKRLNADGGVFSIRGGHLEVGERIEMRSRFEFFGGTVSAPLVKNWWQSYLVMGKDFEMSDLFSGALFGGATIEAAGHEYDLFAVEISNGATGTHSRDKWRSFLMQVGTDQGAGTFRITGTGNFCGYSLCVGYNGTIVQEGGIVDGSYVKVGTYDAPVGTYYLKGGDLTPAILMIGNGGTIIQTGGTCDPQREFQIVCYKGYQARYELHGGTCIGNMKTVYTASNSGPFVFVQTGGTFQGEVELGGRIGDEGTYELRGGVCDAQYVYVGKGGTGHLIQTGGVLSHRDFPNYPYIYVGFGPTGEGTYELIDGELRGSVEVGLQGKGTFIQSGGELLASKLRVGSGTYEMRGGHLYSSSTVYVNKGRFIQTGGTCEFLGDQLVVGYLNPSGIYEMKGGQLILRNLNIQDGEFIMSGGTLELESLYSYGKLELLSPDVTIRLSDRLRLNRGTFAAVPGAKIHMTGSAFENFSQEPDNLAGLGNLKMIFEGGSVDIDPFEVAGEDMGAVFAGLESNFALGTLQLGGDDIGYIQLVDDYDNRPDWDGSEALYVENLILGIGSMLDLNGFNLYYFSLGGTGSIPDNIDTSHGGSVQQIPEPATMLLLALGACLPLLRKHR